MSSGAAVPSFTDVTAACSHPSRPEFFFGVLDRCVAAYTLEPVHSLTSFHSCISFSPLIVCHEMPSTVIAGLIGAGSYDVLVTTLLVYRIIQINRKSPVPTSSTVILPITLVYPSDPCGGQSCASCFRTRSSIS
jgi:hypothetical protein